MDRYTVVCLCHLVKTVFFGILTRANANAKWEGCWTILWNNRRETVKEERAFDHIPGKATGK
jgi:hypothetical protein